MKKESFLKKYSNYIFREDTIMIQDAPLVSRVKVPAATNTKTPIPSM